MTEKEIEARTLNDVWHYFAKLESTLGCGAASLIWCYAKDRDIEIVVRKKDG